MFLLDHVELFGEVFDLFLLLLDNGRVLVGGACHLGKLLFSMASVLLESVRLGLDEVPGEISKRLR